MHTYLIALVLLFSSFTNQVYAISKISLNIERLLPEKSLPEQNTQWLVENLKVFIDKPFTSEQQLVLQIASLNLSKLTKSQQKAVNFALKISCKKFLITTEQIECSTGNLQLLSLETPELQFISGLSFVYKLSSQQLDLKLNPLQSSKLNGQISVKFSNNIWHVIASLNQLQFYYIRKWFSLLQIDLQKARPFMDSINGGINSKIHLSGNEKGWFFINLKSVFSGTNIELQQPDKAEILSENLSFNLDIVANRKTSNNDFTINIYNTSGALFVEPYYIEFTGKERIKLKGQSDARHYLDIKHLSVLSSQQSDSNSLLKGNFFYNLKQDKLQNLKLDFTSQNLKALQTAYIDNLVSGTALQGLKLSGKTAIQLNGIKADKTAEVMTIDLKAELKNSDIIFNKQSVKNLNTLFLWNSTGNHKQYSTISWEQIKYKKMLIGKSGFSFIAHNENINVEQEISIPVFDGRLIINNLSASNIFDNIKISFDGLIEPISLQLMSQQLEWTLLEGKLSALIPHTVYTQKQLQLGGKLWFNLFDGSLSLDKVKLTDPLSDYSRFTANIALNNISLAPLTQTFDFGRMEGRIEGHINELVLENWQPVSFDMYVGTVKNDPESHLISQRAIDNLSSIGGLPGVLSKSFMSFFENFKYEKIGLGCVLKNGLCEMRGVEKAAEGSAYYIVKGGGIPRIDIMGYENNVDWNTLIDRLKSVQQSNKEAVVE